MKQIILSIFIFCLLAPTTSSAMRLSGHYDESANILFVKLSGEIYASDKNGLGDRIDQFVEREFFDRFSETNKQPRVFVELDSVGGDILASYHVWIGYSSSLGVIADVTYVENQCSSACLTLLASSKNRMASSSAIFGIHAPGNGGQVDPYWQPYYVNILDSRLKNNWASTNPDFRTRSVSVYSARDLIQDRSGLFTSEHQIVTREEAIRSLPQY